MATSSRQSTLFGVNDWKAIYQTFREADFQSYDYETLRKSFIDYLRTYYPETFNDYIESSEFIALLDVMAFMGQGLAFRNDLNTRENFIDTAERRDSVIKLANLVSYTPKRNLAGQGYLKVTSVSTTENITDLNGFNLSNIVVLWNDPANASWLEQFNVILNSAFINTQRVGRPGNTQTILGIKTDEYTVNIPPNNIPVVPFTSVVDGTTMNFELVSVTSLDEDNVYEIPPGPTGKFNMLYRNDRLGYGSANTGFFFYFKQGALTNYDFNLVEQIANQVVAINIEGINNTDTWLYQLNLSNGTTSLWEKVDNVYENAYLQNESSQRTIFSVNSRTNDQVSYVFGDGVFSKIPVGNFRAYVRAGNALTYTIDPSEMQSISVTIPYVSRVGRVEILSFTLSLTQPVTNAQVRESLAQIKERAPARYYTQNRMVNGEDYNNFPYTLYSSIIKSKAINRSSIGVSKNLDLLDPTGKYSSTVSFGTDGALYQNGIDGFDTFTINTTGDIITYLTTNLSVILQANRARQYYIANYPRYNVNNTTGDGTVYWNESTVDADSVTGYFYNIVGSANVPIPIGTYTSYNMKYCTTGALVKFTAPAGYYFDNSNRLVSGIPSVSDTTYIWVTVTGVVGDGYSNGEGNLPSGLGPVTLNEFIPTGAIISQIIPVFDNTLSNLVIQDALQALELNQSFSLVFDNSLLVDQDRWSIQPYTDPDYFVKFNSLGNNRYEVTYRSLRYYFGSVSDTRFAFEAGKIVYDPFTGKTLLDTVNVLKSNTQPNNNFPLARDNLISVIGQTVQSDGYADDWSVEVSSIDPNNNSIILDPDFFQEITGYVVGASNIGVYVFFTLVQDATLLERYQIVPSADVVYQYPIKSSIEVVKYEYPVNTVFYAYSENKFYISVQDPTSITPNYSLSELTNWLMQPGRQAISFQYKHNSNNTTRIDPATTNIIDLYVVTQSYYTAYQNWIQDTTNTVPEPNKPTISELNIAYNKVNDYKMISDSVIFNSVVFKPLFGPKAPPALRATIKCIKASNTNASNSEIRSAVLSAMNSYFNINNWNFGDTFYFSELSAYLHAQVGDLISSVVLVPSDPNLTFGDLYEIKCTPYEIFVNAATANDIVVIPALTPSELQAR